ncbi:response regulator transcription factor [Beggiatoa alba]|nr:response regulator transcription factor [Beggiatoa alba]
MKILIADDEPLARERLVRLCKELSTLHVIQEASNGKQVLDLIPGFQPDIVLLDIRMPDMDGLETAQHLATLDTPPAIIFATAFDQYALRAFDNHAVGYLLKPVNKQQLEESLNAARRLSRAQLQAIQQENPEKRLPRYISARVRGNIQLIPLDSIRYFQAVQKYVAVGFIENNCPTELLIEDSLKSLEQVLQNVFIRIHRNALIAERYIIGLYKHKSGSHWLCLQEMDHKLEVSRRHITEIRKIIKSKALG